MQITNFNSLFRLDGKVALITGGSRGIGLFIAAAFLQSGAAKVIITARRENGLRNAVEKLNAIPNITGRASYIVANVGSVDGVERVIAGLQNKVPDKRIHILVNNAGVSWGGPFEDFEDWKVAKTFDVNVRAVFNLSQKMVPFLAEAGTHEDPARLIIVSSIGGVAVIHVGSTGAIAYNASKAAVNHLGRNLAMELVSKNITTNIISPGWFPTRLANPAIEAFGGQEIAAKDNPRGRLGIPEDIAGVAVYLCSKSGAYVNGQNINIDGGKTLMAGNVASSFSDDTKSSKL